MSTYALVRPDGTLDRVLHNIDPTAGLKPGWRWAPVENVSAPPHNRALEIVRSTYVLVDDNAVEEWTVERRPISEQRAAVKEEARRRILGRYPDWKQINMTARAGELIKLMVVKGSLTEAEQAEVAALEAAWAWIKAVRARSDEIEAIDPIPADFAADSRWPE